MEINKYQIDKEKIDELKKEFNSSAFRSYLNKLLKQECANCGCKDNLSPHHVVPLALGGTNRISNIVNLCPICHEKAHMNINDIRRIGIFRSLEKGTIGRKKLVNYDETTENILHKYFNLEIGTKEAKELLGFSNNTRTSWYKLINTYKEKYNIPSTFKNNIDLSQSQKIRNELRHKNNNSKRVEYDKNIENILNDYFLCKIGFKESCEKIGISTNSKSTWNRLVDNYKLTHSIPSDFRNNVDTINMQSQRIQTTKDNINKKRNK